MKKLAALLCLLSAVLTASGQADSITVDVTHPGAAINPGMYGIFFEDINHGVQGGLYGELINNRDFESSRTPEDMTRTGDFVHTVKGWTAFYPAPDSLEGWYEVRSAGAEGELDQVATDPLNTSNPMNLRIRVRTLGKGRFGVGNAGYWGISVVQGQAYDLSFYAHCNAAFSGSVKVSLEDVSGRVYASQVVRGIGSSWKKFSCTLTASGTDAHARFILCPLSTGTVWLDVVSLFPRETFMNRKNGLRKDLAEKIAAVRPGFIRFPGGCVVEGVDLNNRIKWYNTVGDVAARPGHWDLWGYHTTDGMGFQDYLQFCQDVHASPMYVINVGMSCQFRRCQYVPSDSVGSYVDDALNALEYAMGPVTSKWGALRARNGHPRPFNIKYVEIGNENYGPLYQSRYHYFYDAITKKYPGIIPITCTDPSMRGPFRLSDLPGIDSSEIKMIDEHFYESPDFFFKNVHRYDHYSRKGPKVYVGEFAVKKWDNSLKGNLEGALAVSAFFTGCERNADVVRLVSLAPTLVNVNDRTWNPDLINFDSNKSYGDPAYQALKMFKNNLAGRVLPLTLADGGAKGYKETGAGRGMVAFTNPSADCRYKDIAVTIDGKTFRGDSLFTREDMVKAHDGVFRVGQRGSVQLPFRQSVYDFGDSHHWKNYSLSLKAYARDINDLEGFIVSFWTTGDQGHWQWDIGRWRRMYWLEWYDHGYSSYFGSARGNITPGKWYDVSIKVTGDSVYTFLDGKAIHAVKKPREITPRMYASAGVKRPGEVILKVVNATPHAQYTAIDLKGATRIDPQAEAVVLTSASPLDENSFAYPQRISPETVMFSTAGKNFSYSFRPYSVTILKIKCR